jgi:uncharacterized protein (TIGR03083 family)
MLRAAPRSRLNPHRINTTLAIRYGSADPHEIVAKIREHSEERGTARGLDTANALFDLAVHSQDMSLPLGRPFEVPVDAAAVGLDRLWEMGWPFHARRRFGHLRLSATDGGWAVGSGPEVRGPAVALLLLLTGRTEAAAPSLSGPGVVEAVALRRPGIKRTGRPLVGGRRLR